MSARILQGRHLPLPDVPLVKVLLESYQKHGDRIFLDDARTKKQSTFLQLRDNAGAISHAIRNLGQGPGKIVLMVSDSTVEGLTTNLGIWLSGAAAAPVNPKLPAEEIKYFFNTCKSEVVFCGEEYLDKVKKVASNLDWTVTIICPNHQDGVIDYYKCLEEGNSAEGLNLEGWWTGKDHALSILFTSGTTGSPKGVVVRDEAHMFNMCQDLWKQTMPASSEIVLLTSPLYWISNTWIFNSASFTGCRVVIATPMTIKQMIETAREYKPNRWFTGPTALIDICKEEDLDKNDFSSVKAIIMGGSVILPEHRRMISEKIMSSRQITRLVYGSTETNLMAFEPSVPQLDSPKLASIGKVADGVTMKIVDTETGKLQPPNAVGEICVKSAGLLSRYINKKFTEEDLDKDGFWHLGDLGYYDEEENLYYHSRLKDVMKYKGQQIAPAELEGILMKHPDIIECCVVGKTCLEQGGELPAAFIIKSPGSILTEEEVHIFISEKVIDEKKLRGGVFFVESIPRSPVGKVLRSELAKLLT